MKALKALTLLAMTATMTGCSTYSLEELRHTTPSGSAYQNALAARYLDYADNEARNYDWSSSGYFADKGLQAAYGKDVQPETLDQWDLQEPARGEIAAARTDLLNALTPDKIAQKPNDAADAVAYFDCWVENQDEGWQEDEIAFCRDKHLQAVANLKKEPEAPVPETPAPEAPAPEAPAPEDKEEPAPAPVIEAPREEAKCPAPVECPAPAPQPAPKVEKQAYMVLFPFNKSALDANGKLIMEDIIADLENLPAGGGYQIVVNGHTDTFGGARYNMALSKKRSDAVRQYLLDRGVPLDKIQAFGFGETDLKVKTKDGVKEPANRRVEIFVGDDKPADIQQHEVAPEPRASVAPVAPVAASASEPKEKPASDAKAEAPATMPVSAVVPAEAPAAKAPEAKTAAEPPPAQTFSAQIKDSVKEKEAAAAEARAKAEEAVKAAETASQEAADARKLAEQAASASPAAGSSSEAPAAPADKATENKE